MAVEIDWFPLWLSLRVASLATGLATVTGVAAAYLLARGPFRGRAVLEGLTSLPLTLPPTVLGYYLLVALGRQSAFGAWFEGVFGDPLVFTWRGAVVAATVPSIPLVARTTRAAFEDVEPGVLEAARIDGAGALQQLVRILLPLSRRGIAAGVALGFARALGDFGTTLMVAGNIPGRTQTLPIALYDAVQAGRWETAGILAVLLSVVSVAVLVVVARLGEQGA
ncbi:MAG: molybdate ABC transporter permease subunit [Armatimonadota bacterium]|nr:molybdate ABC transporter permease subunit [Armatimonadota bacterium]MDR7422303.1 molybdate ABC transporter permease subunit [Armatimonadota bacterium]MDR7453746.1 molybdate ABC transporter permease subunit [Armatimonadota bacterium]MDR7456275.1 molybdate ABC transporter permease subunit [Armatimonadota bacterium]MDR7496271.1 molybdate ABC transporter permease subunit [Armatimonadota bacterium]